MAMSTITRIYTIFASLFYVFFFNSSCKLIKDAIIPELVLLDMHASNVLAS